MQIYIKKDGIWKYYYDNKNISFEGNFIDGDPEGIHRYYWSNGKLKEEGKYVMGNKEGKWKLFDEHGVLYLVILFKNGKEIKYDGVKIKPVTE